MVEPLTTDGRVSHTPGPWHLGGNGLIVYSVDGYAICDVKTFHGRRSDDKANAALIAAAPELLASLKEVCDWIANGLAASDDAIPSIEYLRETERIARKATAACAKAEAT